MSKLSEKPLKIEDQVNVEIQGQIVSVIGHYGKMEIKIPESLKVEKKDNSLLISSTKGAQLNMIGLYRSLIKNAIYGVKNQWKKTLVLVGVGFRAQVNGSELVLSLGFSHPVIIKAPEGISFQVNENNINITGIDKYLVGEVTSSIRRKKKPEPY